MLQELGDIFRNFYGLMRYGILQHDLKGRLPETSPLAAINAFEWRCLENQRFLTKTPMHSAVYAVTPSTMVPMRS